MSRPNNRAQTPTPARNRPQRAAVTASQRTAGDGTRRPVQVGRGPVAAPRLLGGSFIEAHRAIASVALVMLLLVSLLTPFPPSAPDTAPFITPRIGGSNSIPGLLAGDEVQRAIFPYLTIIEKSQGSSTIWPGVDTILRLDPSDPRVRKAFIGQMFASSAGGLDTRVKDTGMASNPAPEVLDDIETAYETMLDGPRRSRGINGLVVTQLLRAQSLPDDRRVEVERLAIGALESAISIDPNTWQFTYNWALANMLGGNYAAAYEGLRTIVNRSDLNTANFVPFWMGLSALRVGDPGEASARFLSAIDAKTPEGGNDAYSQLYEEARDFSREGLGDAQWANRIPGAAYKTYFDALRFGNNDSVYGKWLRLGLQQRAYERFADDMAVLTASSDFSRDARLHHDRARLLSFLGRQSEAEGEYKRAIELGENDPTLRISYGQALESRGDHNGALSQAEQAIRGAGQDPGTADLSSVARAATTTTTSVADVQTAQQLLDANLLRARAWGAQGNTGAVDSMVSGITQQAGQVPAAEAGLLHLYGAFAYEAAGMNDKAASSYNEAWQRLKGLASGTAGRAAALAGLARSTARTGGAQAGVDLLKQNGYDLAALSAGTSSDLDAPDVLQQGAILLMQVGKGREAANALRVSAIVRNLQDARSYSGIGRPLWTANGTVAPSSAIVAAAGAARAVEGEDVNLAAMRYKLAYSLDPAMPDAWNNLGVLYAQSGNPNLASFYLGAAGTVSPGYAWGQHNLAAFAYEQGPASYFTAEQAQGDAIKANGPQSLFWGYNLRYDERGSVPSPAAPPGDFLSRLPAVAILLLLLLHTLVGKDRQTNRMGVVGTRGLLGIAASYVDARAKTLVPGLWQPRPGVRGVLMAIAIPSVIGMLGLAWGASRGSLGALLVFLPVALVISVIAFGANELAQYLAAKRAHGVSLHHNWPLGILLGILSIPFGFVYGLQALTGVRPATTGSESEAPGTSRRVIGRRTRSMEDLDLAYEAQAEMGGTEASTPVNAAAGRLGLSPAARIFFAGLAANLVLGALFGLVYWLTGWPSVRMALFASMLVLAFTSVSEPPADGWAIYRRNAPLWLGIFVIAATIVTLLAVGIM
ncbi:MAG TPA: tetratricopeptide repeat protein [Chloroflexia bacterium]